MASNPVVSGGGRGGGGNRRYPQNRAGPSSNTGSSNYNWESNDLIDLVGQINFNSSQPTGTDLKTLLQCPSCSGTMQSPIYMCKIGHNICHQCITKNNPARCGVCNHEITTLRNMALEKLSLKAGIECPNKKHGCTFVASRDKLTEHFEYCQYTAYECPVKRLNRSCTWENNISLLEDHFTSQHQRNIVLKPGNQITFKNIDLNIPDKDVQLFKFKNQLFLYNIKIDVLNQVASWSIQYVGCDKNCTDWVYEIHIYKAKEPWRKITFSETCNPYGQNIDELIKVGKCSSIPLNLMRNYLDENRDFTFKFYMREKAERKIQNTY